jgi:hypothetical protein
MYHAIVNRIATKNFERVNAHDYGAILKDCAADVHRRFGAHRALGGGWYDRDALGSWFERFGRLGPTLKLTLRDVWERAGRATRRSSFAGLAPRTCPTAHRTRTAVCTSCGCAGERSLTSMLTKTRNSSQNR